uniref:Uncharacterized protein n=1 Tax=Macaca fascicularis TaxID=9541 RepID=A0A7N9D717_MACFA
MMWKRDVGVLLKPRNYLIDLLLEIKQKDSSRVHLHNVQVCYMCIHVLCWCAAPINRSFTINCKFSGV